MIHHHNPLSPGPRTAHPSFTRPFLVLSGRPHVQMNRHTYILTFAAWNQQATRTAPYPGSEPLYDDYGPPLLDEGDMRPMPTYGRRPVPMYRSRSWRKPVYSGHGPVPYGPAPYGPAPYRSGPRPYGHGGYRVSDGYAARRVSTNPDI